MSSEVLTFKELRWRSFPEDTYRSIDVWEFSLENPDSDGSVILRSMLDNEHYPYSFIAPYPSPTILINGPLVRGPFLLDRLTPGSFERSNAEALWTTVDSFLQEWDPPATRQDLDLDGLVGNMIDSATQIFRLGENAGARHEIPGLSAILSEDWAEFVAIDRMDGVVLAVVTSMD